MNTNHTPAPWKKIIAQPGTMLEVVSENNEYVCSLLGGEEHKQANGRLIAAAPELLEALRAMIDMATDNRTHGPEIMQAVTVIAKATL